MKNSATKVMSSCAQRKGEENSAKLKLHGDETDNSLQTPKERLDIYLCI